tara:strand:+ start:2080 stop:2286 length:207 start_codon:yes stop_codon:yes gene_type:complete
LHRGESHHTEGKRDIDCQNPTIESGKCPAVREPAARSAEWQQGPGSRQFQCKGRSPEQRENGAHEAEA